MPPLGRSDILVAPRSPPSANCSARRLAMSLGEKRRLELILEPFVAALQSIMLAPTHRAGARSPPVCCLISASRSSGGVDGLRSSGTLSLCQKVQLSLCKYEVLDLGRSTS
jgi:hypothetical protein